VARRKPRQITTGRLQLLRLFSTLLSATHPMTRRVPHPLQLPKKPALALRGPAQRSLWISAGHPFNQPLQVSRQGWILLDLFLRPPQWVPNTPAWRQATGRFLEFPPDPNGAPPKPTLSADAAAMSRSIRSSTCLSISLKRRRIVASSTLPGTALDVGQSFSYSLLAEDGKVEITRL
jgi:hypothetical protein